MALPIHSLREDQDVVEIQSLSQSNTKPHAILNGMIQKGKSIDIQNIYNERTKIRKDLLHGVTPIQALLQELENYVDNVKVPNGKYYYHAT